MPRGKRAVLCEKPFAMSGEEASGIAAVSAETGVPIVVGAMHTFDPGWRAAAGNWGDLPEACHTIRSSIVMPPNARFEDVATEVITRPGWPASDESDIEVRAGIVHAGVMGLAIHDLPLVRALLPRFDDLQVQAAAPLFPFGYRILATAGGRRIELHAALTATWQLSWVLEAYSDDQVLETEFLRPTSRPVRPSVPCAPRSGRGPSGRPPSTAMRGSGARSPRSSKNKRQRRICRA